MYRDHLVPSGLRRLTIRMLTTTKSADAFDGLNGISHGKILAAFKAAAPCLGFGADIVFAIDWLFKFTQPQDWEPGARPIVWPSAAEQQTAFGRSASQVKYLNRQLAELGLLVMRDSPNGKRSGTREKGKTGPIIEAYGFDLSPLAMRLDEFQAKAAEAKARRDRIKALRRRATIARNGLRQVFETATAEIAVGFDLAGWQGSAAAAASGLANITDECELAMAVASLERIRDGARDALHECTAALSATADPVETDPKGSDNRPLITTTNELLNPTDTVMAYGRSSSEHGESSNPDGEAPQTQLGALAARAPLRLGAAMLLGEPGSESAALNLTPGELIRLAPKLATYLTGPAPTWEDIVDAADWLRHDLSISKALWSDACITLGRRSAAVAVAVVSAKPVGHFLAGPGAYFFGMVRRAKAGELNLGRTIWGLRKQKGVDLATGRGAALAAGCHG